MEYKEIQTNETEDTYMDYINNDQPSYFRAMF